MLHPSSEVQDSRAGRRAGPGRVRRALPVDPGLQARRSQVITASSDGQLLKARPSQARKVRLHETDMGQVGNQYPPRLSQRQACRRRLHTPCPCSARAKHSALSTHTSAPLPQSAPLSVESAWPLWVFQTLCSSVLLTDTCGYTLELDGLGSNPSSNRD